ncbi:10355_t:CDS:2, partial [Acaulospora morrowiae]
EGVRNPDLKAFDYFLFHAPYCKLVQKSFGRLFYNDFIRNPENPIFNSVQQFRDMNAEEALRSKDVEKAFIAISKADYAKKVAPTLLASTQVGNMYCASLYACLASALSNIPVDELVGKRLGLFSYGSGLASTLFSFRIIKPITEIHKVLDISSRLESRVEVPPEKFVETLHLREKTHGKKDFKVTGDGSPIKDALFKGTYYLEHIDSKWRRTYKRYI